MRRTRQAIVVALLGAGLLLGVVLPAVGQVDQSGSNPIAQANGGEAQSGLNTARSGDARSGDVQANPQCVGQGTGADNTFPGGGAPGGLVNIPINLGVNLGLGACLPILSGTTATSGSAVSGPASASSGPATGGNGGSATATGGTTTNAGADLFSNVTGTETIDRSVIAPFTFNRTSNITGTNQGPVFIQQPGGTTGGTTGTGGATFAPAGQSFGTAGGFTGTGQQGTVFIPAQSTGTAVAQQAAQQQQQQQQGGGGQQQQQQGPAGQQQQQQ